MSQAAISTKKKLAPGDRFYDQPGFWGLEYRAIHPHLGNDVMSAILDGIEKSSSQRDFGYSKDHISIWLDHVHSIVSKKSIYDESIPFNKHADLLMPPVSIKIETGKYACRADAVKKIAESESEEKLIINYIKKISWKSDGDESQMIGFAVHKYPQLKFLFHDWRLDPVSFNQISLLSKIRMARVQAFRKLMREDPPQQVMREFFLDSGLLDAFAKSLGIQTEVLTP